jgi:hypothetical protein
LDLIDELLEKLLTGRALRIEAKEAFPGELHPFELLTSLGSNDHNDDEERRAEANRILGIEFIRLYVEVPAYDFNTTGKEATASQLSRTTSVRESLDCTTFDFSHQSLLSDPLWSKS